LSFLLEISLLACIICLLYTTYLLKQKSFNAKSFEDQKSFLEDQLTNQKKEFNSRELLLNKTIENLQSSFDREQIFLEERKKELNLKEKKLLSDISDLEFKLLEETEGRKKVLSQKKSSEVRLGTIAETLAPFLDQFEFNPEQCTFLGKPIDYISFGEEEVTIIEIKSGNSQLNQNQRRIRDQIKNNKVSWKEIRIK
jgi:predicted Holliday junction resolvase-like endonuclease